MCWDATASIAMVGIGGFATALTVARRAPRAIPVTLAAGPLISGLFTSNPNETPAIWCLFSIGLLLISLSPAIRSSVKVRGWWIWPKAWTA